MAPANLISHDVIHEADLLYVSRLVMEYRILNVLLLNLHKPQCVQNWALTWIKYSGYETLAVLSVLFITTTPPTRSQMRGNLPP